jgi:hypothetical protein
MMFRGSRDLQQMSYIVLDLGGGEEFVLQKERLSSDCSDCMELAKVVCLVRGCLLCQHFKQSIKRAPLSTNAKECAVYCRKEGETLDWRALWIRQ